MAKFYQIGYQGKHLESLNIVHRCCNLLHLSDISKCDRIALDKFVISDMAEESAKYISMGGTITIGLHLLERVNPSLMLLINTTTIHSW